MLTCPRDKELRFTVRDSPDYYKLKISVFNDDKKTELVGEAEMSLMEIVVPGGGKSDLWQTLHCKGRYAGDVRIELTYYDTRPKDENAEAVVREAPTHTRQETAGEGVGGPRQPKPVKRRPLPANPTDSSPRPALPDHTQSSPHTYSSSPTYTQTTQTQPANAYVAYDEKFGAEPQFDEADPGLPYGSHQALTSVYNNDEGNSDYSGRNISEPVGYTQSGKNNGSGQQSYMNGGGYIERANHRPSTFNSRECEPEGEQNWDNTFQEEDWAESSQDDVVRSGLPLPNGRAMPHSNSAPVFPHQTPTIQSFEDAQPQGMSYQHRSSLPNGNAYEERRNQYTLLDNNRETQAGEYEDSLYDQEPPPPPVHRHSAGRTPPRSNAPHHSETYPPISGPTPNSIRNHRMSVSASPLSQVHSQIDPPLEEYPPSASPTNSFAASHSGASFSSRTSYSQAGTRPVQHPLSLSPSNGPGLDVPPSLVPGYEPSIAAEESERMIQEKRMSTRQPYTYDSSSVVQQTPPRIGEPRHSQTQFETQSPLQRLEKTADRRGHRSSAPIIKPRAVSPDVRRPIRKSVSPAPEPAPAERRVSAIPFSPDSYDSFNPSLSSSSTFNQPGPKYSTPEQAKETAIQHERNLKLGDGPIIGSDGREIDPSDHLPTDTWAPEPEPKVPRKRAEVTVRFKHSPQGAQPMPPSRRPFAENQNVARPHSIANPMSFQPPENVSPTTAHRNRLRKRMNAVPTPHPASSPIVPTVNNTTPERGLPRSYASDYPMREHDNRGYGSSPNYTRNSPGGASGAPPPLPAKVPIHAGQEDWNMNALSEEMKRIDIGVGGERRTRRSRYGL